MIAVFQFADPSRLWLAAGMLVLFGVLVWLSASARARQLAAFADPSLLAGLLASHSRVARIVKNTLLFLALAALGLALARPQWGVVEEEVVRARGEDLVFILDLSKSMLATDAQGTRLQRAKNAILDYMRRQQGGRLGLVVFAGNAFLRCPLTLDYAAFEESVAEASTEDLYVAGSNIGEALAVAAGAFEKKAERRVLVLLTDGEDLEKLGVKMAEGYAREGVVIFTVGVGTPAGAQIQTIQDNGTSGPLLDENGQPVVSRLDEETLRAVASATGGAYRRLDRIGEAMADVQRALRQTEVSASGKARRRGVDRYAWFLAVAILLLLGESLLTTRRRETAPAN